MQRSYNQSNNPHQRAFKFKIEDQYEILDKLGEGTYGRVYKALNKDSGQIVALKQIKLDNDDEGVPSTALREISLLKEFSIHPNIVSLYQIDYKPQKKQLSLVFEFVDMDLKKFIDSFRRKDIYDTQTKQIRQEAQINRKDIKIIMYQILKGLEYCHDHRIIHRDVKPQNVLIDQQRNIKIADFGLARTFSLPIKTLTHEVETLWYRAPEILLGAKHYSLGVDTWSLGCIMFELMSRRILFQGDCEIDQIFKMFKFFGTPTDKEWPGITQMPYYKTTFPQFQPSNDYLTHKLRFFDPVARDLFLKFITLDPNYRITVRDALLHPYFDDLTQQEKMKYHFEEPEM